MDVNWTDQVPTQSGVYWFLHYRDQLAEDISIVEVNLEADEGGRVSGLAFAPASLRDCHGIWLGPIQT
jgi:hypothetical protein